MGRKSRATKAETIKPTPPPKSPPQVQTSAAEANPINTSSDHPLSDMSRSLRKKSKAPAAVIRRSLRTNKIDYNQEIEPVVEEPVIVTNISESEKEDGPPLNEENKSPNETSDETERSSQKDNPGVPDIKYKSMYINSQKKIEALVEENRELSKNLEHARGKVDVYEKQSHVYSEVMTVIASLCKVNENLSAKLQNGASSEDTEIEGRVSKKKKGA